MKYLLAAVLAFAGFASAASVDFDRQAAVVVVSDGVADQGPGQAGTKSALDALRAAVYDRNQTVAQYLAGHPLADRKLGRVTLDWRRGDTRYLSDGSSSTEYWFPFTGPFLNLVMPVTGTGQLVGRTACPCCNQEWPADKTPPAGVKLVPLEADGPTDYTGILVEAGGLDLVPAFFPRVMTEDGREVVGPGFADPSALAERGQARYFTSRIDAGADDRVGANPLVVRALRVTGSNRCDLVVSMYDATRLHGSRNTVKLLSECRVGILTQ